MPKLIYRLPKYSLHKPSGQAKVRHNGRTIYLGKFGSPESKEAYARFIANLPKQEETPVFARPVQADPAPAAPLLVGDVVLRFFDTQRGITSATGYRPASTLPSDVAFDH